MTSFEIRRTTVCSSHTLSQHPLSPPPKQHTHTLTSHHTCTNTWRAAKKTLLQELQQYPLVMLVRLNPFHITTWGTHTGHTHTSHVHTYTRTCMHVHVHCVYVYVGLNPSYTTIHVHLESYDIYVLCIKHVHFVCACEIATQLLCIPIYTPDKEKCIHLHSNRDKHVRGESPTSKRNTGN